MDYQVPVDMVEPLTLEPEPNIAEEAKISDFDESLISESPLELEAVGPDSSRASGTESKKTEQRITEQEVQSKAGEELTSTTAPAPALRKAHLEELSSDEMSERQVQPNASDDRVFEGAGLSRANVKARIEKTATETKRHLPLNVSQTPTPDPPLLNVGPEDHSKPIAELAPKGDSPGDATQDRSAEIFAKADESDRSPLAWLARLIEAAKPQPDAQPIKQPHSIGSIVSDRRPAAVGNALRSGSQHRTFRPSAQVEQPLELSQATRRFLKPLVGIDPASVPVYAGSSAAELASNNHADALTIAEVVTLGSGYVSESPEQLGVLAHELTHIARQRQPRFVPPIARQVPAHSLATTSVGTIDEEVLARRVEARVIRAAKATDRDSSAQPTAVSTKSFLPPEEIASSPLSFESSVAARDWGGLPAPWESLPDWMSTPTGESISSAPTPAPGSDDISLPPSLSSSGQVAAVQHAGDERTLDDNSSSEPASMHDAAESVKQVEPDLDAMAQQVYSILKRRLAAERRRESC